MTTRSLITFLPLTLLAAFLASYAIWQDKAGNIVTGLPTGWGDMIVHIRAAIFYADQRLPQESFLLSGESVGYAWPADYLSSLLLQLNIPLTVSLAFPTMLLAALGIFALQTFAYHLTRSHTTAVITTLLFLGFSGLSGFYALPELLKSSAPTWTEALRTLPHHVTAWHDANLVILNPFVMTLHQRSYLLGIPLLIAAMWLASQYITTQNSRFLYGSTFAALLLAVSHPFTWAAWLLIFPAWLFLAHNFHQKFSRLEYIKILLSYIAVAAIGYAFVQSLQPSAASNLAFNPGWLAQTELHQENWLLFWCKNIGLYCLLIPLAIHHLWRTNRPLATGLLASFMPFAAANVFQFTPWDWDNTKLFVPTWIFFCLATASILNNWWSTNNLPARKTLLTTTIFILIFSGSLEILRVISHHQNPLPISTPADLIIGKTARTQTNANDIILTAANPPNHPVFLYSGRPSLMAYEGWLWSQGWRGVYEPRITAAQDILRGHSNAYNLLQQYDIDIVAIGPPEIAIGANQAWFNQNFPQRIEIGDYVLYRVSMKN